MEQTFIILKPDCMKAGLAGKVIERFEAAGFKIVAAKMARLNDAILRKHYAHLTGKPFFPVLAKFMKRSPVLMLVLERRNAVELAREMCGVTDSKKAKKGTIRADYGKDVQSNVIHASDSVKTAKKEIRRFFKNSELVRY